MGELNGKPCTILEFDKAHGYWKVRMEDGSGKAFRAANLEAMNEAEAMMFARCQAFASEKQRERESQDAAAEMDALADESVRMAGARGLANAPAAFQGNAATIKLNAAAELTIGQAAMQKTKAPDITIKQASELPQPPPPATPPP